DIFPESGPHDKLLDKYGLSVEDIVTAVEEAIKRE
ncbi:MAG: hypothetical protein PWQ70_2084, partial [Clostridiales bacterium]|nr:hypothetical protein [Clostridiales bacterium]